MVGFEGVECLRRRQATDSRLRGRWGGPLLPKRRGTGTGGGARPGAAVRGVGSASRAAAARCGGPGGWSGPAASCPVDRVAAHAQPREGRVPPTWRDAWVRSLASELGAARHRARLRPRCATWTRTPPIPVIGDRSLGSDPRLVAELASAIRRGDAGRRCGGLRQALPGARRHRCRFAPRTFLSVEHDKARLEAVELVPFRVAVEAGVASVMTSHVVVRSVDESMPATLSRPVVTGLLREELSFDGVVFTDDMEMGALRNHWSIGDAAVRAAAAGCDLLCVCKTADFQVEAVEALVRAFESGDLPFAEADASRRSNPSTQGALGRSAAASRSPRGPKSGGRGRWSAARGADRRGRRNRGPRGRA